jgi:hypothetical protein
VKAEQKNNDLFLLRATQNVQTYSGENLRLFSVEHEGTQKASFGCKRLNEKVTLMSLDNQVSAGISWKEYLTQR